MKAIWLAALVLLVLLGSSVAGHDAFADVNGSAAWASGGLFIYDTDGVQSYAVYNQTLKITVVRAVVNWFGSATCRNPVRTAAPAEWVNDAVVVKWSDCKTGANGVGNNWETALLGGAVATTDGDGDGVADASDNCPADSNLDQSDSNGDRFGDVCQAAVLADFGPVGGISLDPQLPGSSGSDGWLAEVLAGGMAVVVMTGGGVWYARRRHVR